jgi:hypothetical protein
MNCTLVCGSASDTFACVIPSLINSSTCLLRYREEGKAAKRKELAAEGGGRAAKKARKAAKE